MDKVGCSDGIYLPSIELSNFEGVSIIFEVSIIPVQFEVEEITFYVTPRARINNSKYAEFLCKRLVWKRARRARCRAGEDPKVNESHSRKQQKTKN
jgi:hypothetical protein